MTLHIFISYSGRNNTSYCVTLFPHVSDIPEYNTEWFSMYRENYCLLSSCFRHLRVWYTEWLLPPYYVQRELLPPFLLFQTSQNVTQWLMSPYYVQRELLPPFLLFQTSQSVIHRMITVPILCTERIIASFPPVSDILECDTEWLLSPVAQCVARRAPMQQCVRWLVRAPSSS